MKVGGMIRGRQHSKVVVTKCQNDSLPYLLVLPITPPGLISTYALRSADCVREQGDITYPQGNKNGG